MSTPRLRRSGVFAGTLVLYLFTTASCRTRPFSGAVPLLINGKDAQPGQFAPVLKLLNSGCTASKIGERHLLTAAHCVLTPTGEIAQNYGVGKQLHYAHGVREDAPRGSAEAFRWGSPRIVKVWVHPTFQLATRQLGNYPATDSEDVSDLAVIEVDAEPLALPFYPIATKRTLQPGDGIILLGYGCSTPDTEVPVGQLRLKYGKNSVVALHNGQFLTRGGTQPATCPGDSGGPVLRETAPGKHEIVGVNSTCAGSWESQFARVDAKSSLDGGVFIARILAGSPPVPETFPDTKGHVWELDLARAMKQGIAGGLPDGRFDPEASINRAQAVSMLLAAINAAPGAALPIPAAATGRRFPDVPATHWAAARIETAATEKLVTGLPDGTFAPDRAMTRAELAGIVRNGLRFILTKRNALNLLPGMSTLFFLDTQTHWAHETVNSMAGFCRSLPPRKPGQLQFEPDAPASRAFAATAFSRVLLCLEE